MLSKTFEMLSKFKFPFLSTSAKIGFKPSFITQLAEITKDLGVTMILSPCFKFNDLRAISRATLPFDTDIEYLLPI